MNSKALSEDKTRKAIKSCAKWLHYCLTIGWDKSQLDALEKIWWDHHDEKGNLKPNASQFKSKEPDRIVRCSVSTGANPLTIRESKDNIPSLSENFKKFSLMDEAPTIASDKTVLNIPEPDSQLKASLEKALQMLKDPSCETTTVINFIKHELGTT